MLQNKKKKRQSMAEYKCKCIFLRRAHLEADCARRAAGAELLAPVLTAQAGAVGPALARARARRVARPRLPHIVLHARHRNLQSRT